MITATISGTLIDSDGTPWVNAHWTCVAVSPSSRPIYTDGSYVVATFGQLSATGEFSGSIPRTDAIQPSGTTLTLIVYSVTSAPPSVVSELQITTPTIDLGSLISPRIQAPRIQAAALVYAYSETEVINPTNGNGYVNTTENDYFLFVGEDWVPINAGSPIEQIYPPAGIAVSNGSAWGVSIPTSDVARISSASTIFQGTIAAPTVNVIDDVVTGTQSLINAYQTNMASGAITGFYVGINHDPLNFVQIGFQLIGLGNPANIGVIGFPGGSQATFDNSGNWTFPGIVTAAAKSFNIPHPRDASKRLIHGCIEGPEFAVYYRGEAETQDGAVEITLPDYFEDMALPEGRTVLLTPIFTDENDFSRLACSEIEDGKFTVVSLPATDQRFFWEVKAVRSDISLAGAAPEPTKKTKARKL